MFYDPIKTWDHYNILSLLLKELIAMQIGYVLLEFGIYGEKRKIISCKEDM